MVWEPFALAILFGLLVSAAIYFIVMWPQVEPDDEVDEADDAELPTGEPAEREVSSSE
ncbi:MAG: hypothetical protein K8M05_08600 [Deltaproteobacteria bacterium]|nr:hypothetical protein [Kofleriaceae bacterium]